MQLEYLEYICRINQCRSIAAAARELYLGTATLRAILKRVEEELGFPIFQRGHDCLELTTEGEEAITLARDIAAIYDEIKHLGRHPQSGRPSVKLLCSPSINCALAAPISSAMSGADGFGDLLIAETTGIEVSAKILQNEFNIALTYFGKPAYKAYKQVAEKYQIRVHTLFHDHLYLLMRHDNPLSGQKEIDRNRLRGKEFALLSHFTLSNDSIASTKSIERHNRITIFSNVPLIKRAVIEQDMLSILSGYAIQYDQSAEQQMFSAVPLVGLQDENEMDLCLIHREKNSLSPTEQYVVDFIKDYFAGIQVPAFAPESRIQTDQA